MVGDCHGREIFSILIFVNYLLNLGFITGVSEGKKTCFCICFLQWNIMFSYFNYCLLLDNSWENWIYHKNLLEDMFTVVNWFSNNWKVKINVQKFEKTLWHLKIVQRFLCGKCKLVTVLKSLPSEVWVLLKRMYVLRYIK